VASVSKQTKKLAEIRFKGRPEALQQVRNLVRRTTMRQGCASELVDLFVLAIDEACANVIRHGYGRGYTGDIILEVLYSQGELIFRLTDFAKPVDVATIKSRDLNDIRPGGLGVHFIKKIMDHYKFLDTPKEVGNILEMRKRIEGT
jgi:sigma-B regulation protein RsbU (phosphoserine phosphatase)